MIIPDLTNVKALKCVGCAKGSAQFTINKVYPVRIDNAGAYIRSINFIYGEGDNAPATFEIIYNDDAKDAVDSITNPSHYEFFGENSMPLIIRNLTQEEFLGACKFNSLKYKLRVGKKDDTEKEIKKSLDFEKAYDERKSYCRELTKEEAFNKMNELCDKFGFKWSEE